MPGPGGRRQQTFRQADERGGAEVSDNVCMIVSFETAAVAASDRVTFGARHFRHLPKLFSLEAPRGEIHPPALPPVSTSIRKGCHFAVMIGGINRGVSRRVAK
jgi:hypothetical protein